MGTINQSDQSDRPLLLDRIDALDRKLEQERRLLNLLLIDCVVIGPSGGQVVCRHCARSVATHVYHKYGIDHEPGCVVGRVIHERA